MVVESWHHRPVLNWAQGGRLVCVCLISLLYFTGLEGFFNFIYIFFFASVGFWFTSI